MRAIRAINECNLVRAGTCTYQGLGYDDGLGHVPAVKLHEHLLILHHIEAAEQEKYGKH